MISMYYLRKVADIHLLEMELRKLKDHYTALLQSQANHTQLNQARKMIKIISGRINILIMESTH